MSTRRCDNSVFTHYVKIPAGESQQRKTQRRLSATKGRKIASLKIINIHDPPSTVRRSAEQGFRRVVRPSGCHLYVGGERMLASACTASCDNNHSNVKRSAGWRNTHMTLQSRAFQCSMLCSQHPCTQETTKQCNARPQIARQTHNARGALRLG